MASGYVVAAFLEAAGLIGLVIAAIKIRAERQAKVAELRSYLRSGQIAPSAANPLGSPRIAGSGGRVVAVPFAPDQTRTLDAQVSAARSALRRAITPGERRVRAHLGAAVSAG
ncbi:hypothetical protein ACLBX9_31470 [Methylobacterium sp. A49B]|uniref:Uncharacterized protein n=1 Tax=Methylobacterium mesophilicum SR1.6/6 TaxID=908290 RepID=A0A6B9FMP3_9HYPH|nr:hypothetical protein [Methylobacterium mesophilicum]QGY03823.1 hypothetical protein MMSR116_19430 [Methylobacterium mesophilicum SR1.6/6]